MDAKDRAALDEEWNQRWRILSQCLDSAEAECDRLRKEVAAGVSLAPRPENLDPQVESKASAEYANQAAEAATELSGTKRPSTHSAALAPRLRELRPYLQHKLNCHLTTCEGTHATWAMDKHRCTCGLDALLGSGGIAIPAPDAKSTK